MTAARRMLPPLDPQRSIPARIAEIAAYMPHALAVTSAGSAWTFARLQAESVRIARALLRQPVGTRQPVALMFGQDVQLIGAILGTLYAGRCFAVLDPGFPTERNFEILDNLGSDLLIADRAHAADAAAVTGPACRVIIDETLPEFPKTSLPGLDASPDSPLGVFHTTGTTGAPKGLLWRQSLSLRRALTDRDDTPIDCGDRLALLTSLCFPAAISDTFNALLNGASLHLYDMRHSGPTWLAEWLQHEQISCLRSPVALFRSLAGSLAPGARLAGLRALGLSGDALNPSDVSTARGLLPDDCRIIHRYSMSEAGMVARNILFSDTPIDADADAVPAGVVAPGKTVRLLDADGRAVPGGAAGEVAIGADGLVAGYWLNGRLVPLPTVPDPERPGGRLYRSGDIGRFLGDGRLQLVGRADHRVKIRGYRVEVQAIEAALRALGQVHDAAVAVHPDASGERSLTAFVVPVRGATAADIRHELRKKLPGYMVPSTFVTRSSLPLAANGKVDRGALGPEACMQTSQPARLLAPSSTADRIGRIFAELLGRDDFGPDDDFFALGGHSLLAARVLARVEAECNRRLPLSAFYAAPTATGLAAVLESGEATNPSPSEALDQVRQRALHDLGWL
ncbi:non-ribosomal peptide synthetase [Thioalkalivibrio paradoxus]|nr:non-ribosomal peptide synthetase [Thioalkalivibrio paradoxus]